MRKEAKWNWTEEQETAYTLLKDALCNACELGIPDFTKEFLLSTDASGIAIGGVINQIDDEGRKKPISFVSKSLTPAERRYSTIERELYALYWSIKQFRHYLYGKSFIEECDHKPLSYGLKNNDVSARLLKWNLYLNEFDFTIKYVPGQDNIVADTLSRTTILNLNLPKSIESTEEQAIMIRLAHSITGHGNIKTTTEYLSKNYS